ncbi:helix-turn-helix domain-containing protein, partial [Micromonospora zhanjiangensis]
MPRDLLARQGDFDVAGDDGVESVRPAHGGGLPGPPGDGATPAGYVIALRALKQWSGLTYRQLQRQAEAVGDALPHSTVAAALGRGTLPRPDLVRALVRACGAGEAAV